MNTQEISLVRTSFSKLAPISDQAAALFYARLFELDPALRLLFRGDMQTQGRKLMAMIGGAVSMLDQLDALLPTLRQLGSRHVIYGVRDEDYDTVGEALLWTLRKGLGSEFTAEVNAAWSTTFQMLAGVMKGAAAPAAAVA